MALNYRLEFFEEMTEDKLSPQKISSFKNIPYTLNDITLIEMKVFNSCIYMSVRLKKNIKKDISIETAIIKLKHNKIISEYPIFNKHIYYFQIKENALDNTKPFFFCLGSDFKEVIIGTDKTFLLLSSLKIFSSSAKQYDPIVLYLLRNIDSGEIYQGKEFKKNHEMLTGVTCFDVKNDLSSLVMGLEKGEILLLRSAESNTNLTCCSSYSLVKMTKATKEDITNVAFSNWKNSTIIFFTTLTEIFYYFITPINEKSSNTFTDYYSISQDCGAASTCFACKYNNILFASPIDTLITQYEQFERGPSWFIEGNKSCLAYFKQTYLIFLTDDFVMKNITDKTLNKPKETLIIFDFNNKISAYSYNQQKGNILGVTNDDYYIYLLIENELDKAKSIMILTEKDRLGKLNQFYIRNEYDKAYFYSKTMSYDKETVSSISNSFGLHLYNKGDYKRSIEEYIKTINYISPSFIIQLFIEGPKFEYLISYLEAIHQNEEFIESITKDEMKDYTALLFNSYIKQKKYKKMKEFIDNSKCVSKNHELNIKVAIEICKETKQMDLALSIAENSKLIDNYIEVLIEIKRDYNEALLYLDKEQSIAKKFRLMMKYGQVLLQNNPNETMKILKPIITNLINIKIGKEVLIGTTKENDELKAIKYDTIIPIFLNQESELEILLDHIIKNDYHCSQLILHKRIELYLSQLSSSISPFNKSKIQERITDLLKDKILQSKFDKNYLLMLFKTHQFTNGIIVLCEIMELHHELLEIYMDNKAYDKLISICETYGQSDRNIWIQILRYFIERYNEDDKEEIDKYIKLALKKITAKEDIGPIVLMQIMKSTNYNMKYATIKEFVIESMRKQLGALEIDKNEKENKEKQLSDIQLKISKLKQVTQLITFDKCSRCHQDISPPFFFFMCKHMYHCKCLGIDNTNTEKSNEVECLQCKNNTIQLTQRLKQNEELANDHDSFFIELNNKQKKFDLITKYLGKGIFKMDEN